MFRKLLKKFKKKSPGAPRIEIDGVPVKPREAQPMVIPSGEMYQITNDHHNALNADNFNGLQYQTSTPSSSCPNLPTNPVQLIPTVNLSVSNSHGFHIGDVQNISLGEGAVAHFNSASSGLSQLGNSLTQSQIPKTTLTDNDNTNNLEHIYDKIKDWEVSFIAENAGTEWKPLANCLDLDTTLQANIEERVKGNVQEAVSEVLRCYLNDYPDTSIGYIANILRESGHGYAVAQLTKLRS